MLTINDLINSHKLTNSVDRDIPASVKRHLRIQKFAFALFFAVVVLDIMPFRASSE